MQPGILAGLGAERPDTSEHKPGLEGRALDRESDCVRSWLFSPFPVSCGKALSQSHLAAGLFFGAGNQAEDGSGRDTWFCGFGEESLESEF